VGMNRVPQGTKGCVPSGISYASLLPIIRFYH